MSRPSVSILKIFLRKENFFSTRLFPKWKQSGIRGEVKELIDFYSLDAIIAVGYRVSSLKVMRFRQWATKILKEYITKGFAMDDERLKQGTAVFGKDYVLVS